MSFKKLLIIVYSVAGLLIALFTAVMTYVIIGEHIGPKMFSKIALVVISAMPIIALISYGIGRYFFKKFARIDTRLEQIAQGDFYSIEPAEQIEELRNIHHLITILSARLSSSIEALRAHNRVISDMTVSFAHDVKTPLTIIDGYMEEIRDGIIGEQDLPATIDKLKQETAYINDLSTDILEYVHSMRTQRDAVQILLVDLIDEITGRIMLFPDTYWDIDIPADSVIRFNRMDLKKLLMNLLHNSAKFTSQGSIRISIEKNSIVVEDTGIGIDPEYFPRLFEPYSTADKSRNRQKSGLGLGLSIAKNLAFNNGYDLLFDVTVKIGSRAVISPL